MGEKARNLVWNARNAVFVYDLMRGELVGVSKRENKSRCSKLRPLAGTSSKMREQGTSRRRHLACKRQGGETTAAADDDDDDVIVVLQLTFAVLAQGTLARLPELGRL